MPKSIPSGLPRDHVFITSRSRSLPKDPEQMSNELWFNMWTSKLWPYRELGVGDTLYWYDPIEKAVVWRSRVRQVDHFKYATKNELRAHFRDVFGDVEIEGSYFDKKKAKGYSLAYKIDSLDRIHVPKPEDFTFPRKAWVRCDDEPKWRRALAGVKSSTSEISKAIKEVVDSGYFTPGTVKDERKKVRREIVRRRGQPEFRKDLIDAYGGRCAITGCDAVDALEAAHIRRYTGESTQHVANGLLLRADIHTLFDLNLIGIVPESLSVAVAPAIKSTVYGELEGKKISVPTSDAIAPNKEVLAERWKLFSNGKS
jgi:HNH endonuclease